MTPRRAVVVGGARGIGAAVVARLREDGLSVLAADLEPAAADVVVDVADEGSVRDAFREAGPVDVLVNCAGITLPGARVDAITPDAWSRTLAVNATGTFLCMRAALPGMAARGWGRIVNIASSLASRGTPLTAAYTASKAAVVGLTRAAAADYAADGITVNAVAPGYVQTPMLERLPPALLAQRREEIGARRFAAPEEIASVVGFLASADASYVTGAVVEAAGGFRI